MNIDFIIVIAFIIYSVAIGFLMRKQASRSLLEYFLAGKTLKGWQSGLSMAATQYAADTPLLVTGLVATAGIFSLWRLWVYAIAFLMMGFIFGACWRRSQVLTDAEFTELRYHGRWASVLRVLKAVHMGTLVNCTVMAMVLLAAARIAEPFLYWHQWLPSGFIESVQGFLTNHGLTLTTLPADHPDVYLRSADNLITIFVIVGFTVLYSSTGGLRSVVATDVLQFAIAMAATAVYAWIVVDKAGGLGSLPSKLSEIYGEAASRRLLSFKFHEWNEATMLFLGVLAVQWFAQVNSDGTGYLAQRSMACRTDRDAKLAAVVFTFSQVVLRSLLWLPLVLGLLILYPAKEILVNGPGAEQFTLMREATFARGIYDFLPVGVRGLMLTGMLAALASTVDTHLNWGSSYWTNDLYKGFLMQKILKREAPQHELVWVARLSNLGILIVSMVIMFNMSSIQKAWHLSLLFGSGLGVVLILRWLWYRINVWSEISAGIFSIIFSVILLFNYNELAEGMKLLYMLIFSTGGILLVTLLTPKEPEKVLIRFYERVQPPGFWGRIADQSICGPRNPVYLLVRKLTATILASLSVFFLIVGIGQMILSTADFGNPPISYAFIISGVLLIPVWWKLGFKE